MDVDLDVGYANIQHAYASVNTEGLLFDRKRGTTTISRARHSLRKHRYTKHN